MIANQSEIEQLKAHINFVQVYLLDHYGDDLVGLAKRLHGPDYLKMGVTPESARQSLVNNIAICKEKLGELEAGLCH